MRVFGPQVTQGPAAGGVDACAEACVARGASCIAFNMVSSPSAPAALDGGGRAPAPACELCGWGPEYAVLPNTTSVYYTKVLPRNDSAVTPAVDYLLRVPTGGVELTGGPFATAFETNLAYLAQFPLDDVLYWFRRRAGVANPPGASSWGWDGGPGSVTAAATAAVRQPPAPPGRNVDGPDGLRGSVAGAFMMGSGGATRWADLPNLRARLVSVVGNISELQGDDGFVMAFLRNETNNHEDPNYVQSWVTHGLLEADAAGVSGAAQALRKHFDWFNYNTDVLARMLPPNSGPGPVQCTPQQRDEGHCVYLIYQGMIHNTRVAGSSVGTARDVQVVSDLYQESWWLDGLAARNQSVIWRRQSPHNYEITAFEAYMDMYVLTGEERYLAAMEGAWDLFRNFWIHVGGSIAINEGGTYPPASYYIGTKPTGELCGSSFWIRLNQRFHRLRPASEVYTAEIERSLWNVILANQAAPDADPSGIRYFAQIEGQKATPTNYVTCCESQGTRTYGALPEFLYSTTANATAGGKRATVYVNLLAPSVYHGDGFRLVQTTAFPTYGTFTLTASATGGSGGGVPLERAGEDEQQPVMLRIPSWSQTPTVQVTVRSTSTGDVVQALTGQRGTYLPLSLDDAQVAEATFPMGLRVSMYNGTTPADASKCNSPDAVRAAVEWGPILLAAMHVDTPRCRQQRALAGPGAFAPPPSGAPAVTISGVDPKSPVDQWLLPAGFDGVDPIFAVNGTGGCIVFRPYYRLQNERFSVYPMFLPSTQRNVGECGVTKENWPAETSTVCLVCPVGQRITAVADAQFGDLAGNCTTGFRPQRCADNATAVKEVVERACVGQQGCSVPVDVRTFGKDPCPGVYKSLGVRVTCAPEQCDVATENWPQETSAVHVGCSAGETITKVVDAEYGVVSGNCTSGFATTGCHADPAVVTQVVRAQCVGKTGCAVLANHVLFGKDPCVGTVKQLAVKVECGAAG